MHRDAVIELSIKLEAIGQSMNDAAQHCLPTGKLLIEAAKELKRGSRNM